MEWLHHRGPRDPESLLSGDGDHHERPCSAGGSPCWYQDRTAQGWASGQPPPADSETLGSSCVRWRYGHVGNTGAGGAPPARASTGCGARTWGNTGLGSQGLHRGWEATQIGLQGPLPAPGVNWLGMEGGMTFWKMLSLHPAPPHPRRPSSSPFPSLPLSFSSPLPLFSSLLLPSMSPHPLCLFQHEPSTQPYPFPALRAGCTPLSPPCSLAEPGEGQGTGGGQLRNDGCTSGSTLWFSLWSKHQSHLEGWLKSRCRSIAGLCLQGLQASPLG